MIDKVFILTFFAITLIVTLSNGSVVPDEVFDPSEYEEYTNLWNDVNVTDLENALQSEHPHCKRSTPEVAELYGYKTEIHTVDSDGYLLTLHRITGNQTHKSPQGKPPILLMHGLLCSSMDWVMVHPEKSIGFLLADAGYDVWLGNSRGNKYSREHTNSKISKKNYWTFSWHEMGEVDLPNTIDYILEVTGKSKIFYAGHSQGTTQFFVMASERPEYNDKIEAMFALAPVSYSKHLISPIFKFLAKHAKNTKLITDLFGMYEFAPSSKIFGDFATKICSKKYIPPKLCMNIIFLFAGFNKDQFDVELLPVILSHIPAGASLYQFYHYAQLIQSGYFRKFDYGLWGNLKKYRWISPPSYKLDRITVPVYMHYSNNDWLAHTTDVKKLHSKLPNVHKLSCISDNKFNHLDFIWAKDVKTLLYQDILDVMSVRRKNIV